MATAYDHIVPPRKRIIHFAQQRLYELKEQSNTIQSEMRMWQDLLQMLKPCTNCNGQGQLCHHIAQDESRFETCTVCAGKGFVE